MTEQTPEQPHPAVLELARLRAGLTAGLTVEQSARLQGATDEELTADATAFAAELGTANSVAPVPRSGGSRGPDVATPTGVAAGAALYADRHPQAVERPAVTDGRNPFATRTYSMESR
ncbi:hypothetical protein [Streptomyces sp. NBC_00986]|uniref:hypothetical protein n=1 Tax=Streptomyces sp. NBC_00986 TaxID=2903702 RepID=UPI00386FED86|nr:hypothetical protein OG504_42785 [Streptomyces sp. NBC_00986]